MNGYGTSFGERLKIIGLDPFVGDDEAPSHQFDQVGLAPAHLQPPLLLLLHIPLAHLLCTYQHKLILTALQQSVVVTEVGLVLFHEQFEVTVVQQECSFLFHKQTVSKGMHESHCHFQFIDLFQSVFGTAVDFVDGKLLTAQCKQLVAIAQLHLQNVASQLIVANLLGSEVEEGHLGTSLRCLSEEVVHVGRLREAESEDAIEGMKLNGVELAAPQDLTLLDLLLLVLCEGPPPENVLLQLGFRLLVQDEQHALISRHDGRVNVDAVLQFEDCLLGHLLVLREVIHLHLVVLLHLELILSLLADGGLQHEAGQVVTHPDHLPDNLVGETVDSRLPLTPPHHYPPLLQVDPHQSTGGHVQALHWVLFRVGVVYGDSVGVQSPPLHPAVADAEVVCRCADPRSNAFELLLFVGKGAQLLAALLGTEDDPAAGDF